MIRLPGPSRTAIIGILDAVALSRQGKPDDAARDLMASFQAAEMTPAMFTDLYHFAFAAMKLHLDQRIDDERFRHLLHVVRTEPMLLRGPSWVQDVYGASDAHETVDEDAQPDAGAVAGMLTEAFHHNLASGRDWEARGMLLQIIAAGLAEQVTDGTIKDGIAEVLTINRRILQAGYAALNQKSWDAARSLARDARRACMVTGDYRGEIDATHLLARIDHESGNLDSAAQQYESVHQMSEGIDYQDGVVRAGHEMARIQAHRGQFLEAEAGFRRALHFYADRRDEANLQAAIDGLIALGEGALSFPDHFLPHLDPQEVLFGSANQYLDIRATALLAEFNDYYRKRLLHKGLAAYGHSPEVFRYALEEARRSAAFVQDEFVASTAEIFLSQPEPELPRPLEPQTRVDKAGDRDRFTTPDTAAASLDELIDYLQADHRSDTFAYRGQTREYPAPLVPSAFRGIIEPGDALVDHTHPLFQQRLRGCGNHFYGDYNYKFNARMSRLFEQLPADAADDARRVFDEASRSQRVLLEQRGALSESRVLHWHDGLRQALPPADLEIYERHAAAWQPFVDTYHRRCIRSAFFRPFKYLLGTTLAQQYGLTSEGLDVTRSLEVAAFFAAHESATGYTTAVQPGTRPPGIIYRFPLADTDIRSRRIDDYDYYTLPPMIDTEDVLQRFERPGLSIDGVLNCFEAYAGAVFLDNLQNTDLFFLPEGALARSRVTRQQAMIILPDELRRDLPNRGPGAGGITFPAYRYIEDIAARDGVEHFYFRHTGQPPDRVHLRREDLWPRDDPFIEIIVAILTAVYPLSAFVPDIMPQRLDLIDAGFDRTEFLQLCEALALKRRMIMLDHAHLMAAQFGALVM
jgi:hypothetical protein